MVKWSRVAVLLPGRLGKQCRERWFNHLDPSVKKTEWTPHEDEVLFNAQVRYHRDAPGMVYFSPRACFLPRDMSSFCLGRRWSVVVVVIVVVIILFYRR